MMMKKKTKIKIEDYFLGKLTIDDIYNLFCQRIKEEIEDDFNRKTATRIRNRGRAI